MKKTDNNNFNKDSVSLDDLKGELNRVKYNTGYRRNFWTVLRNTVSTLAVVAAIAVLISVLVLPVLRIYGASMVPTLNENDIVLSVKGSRFETGDIIAFYYNNKILVKRVIAQAGQWVNIDNDGNVYVDNKLVEEPYITDKALGECDITLPYQVPESKVFVMGDQRSVSVDSRSSTIGCVAEEQIVGKVVFCIWPFGSFHKI
ncbi:MAG: signal peptidase I [Clostridia bacterium]|nr:signal peptidase I [Clostridia bacterium]